MEKNGFLRKFKLLRLSLFAFLTVALAVTLTACGGGGDTCKDGHKLVVFEGSLFEPDSEKAQTDFPDLYKTYQEGGIEAVYEKYHYVQCENCDYEGVALHDHKLSDHAEKDNESHQLVCECGESVYEKHQTGVATCKCGYEIPQYEVRYLYKNQDGVHEYSVTLLATAVGDIVIPEHYEEGVITGVYAPDNTDISGITSITLPESVEGLSITASNLTKIVCKGGTDLVNLDTPALKELDAPMATFGYYKGTSLKNLEKLVVGTFGDFGDYRNVTEFPEALEATVNNHYNQSGYINCPFFVKTLNITENVTFIKKLRASMTDREMELDKLEVINAPGLVELTEQDTFYYAKKLSTINAPKLEVVSDFAFRDLTNLKSVNFPALTHIGYRAFASCSLESFTVPNTVAAMGARALADNKNLKTLYYNAPSVEHATNDTYYEYMLSIIDGCGENAEGGITVTIGKDVRTIPQGLCADCDYISSVVFEVGGTPEKIGNCAFKDVATLTSITLPSSVTDIGAYAFENCTQLKTVTLPTGLKTIGEGAFVLCTAIESLSIPDSVTTIERGAFNYCTKLTSLDVSLNVYVPLDAIDNCPITLFEKINGLIYFNQTLLGADVGTTELDIREGTTRFATYSTSAWDFASLSSVADAVNTIRVPSTMNNQPFGIFDNLTTVIFKEGVTAIPDDAFKGLLKLENVTLPTTLETIGNSAFRETAISSISIPDSVTEIGAYAFDNCDSLEAITLPAGLESMGEGALGDCANLATITLNNDFELTYEMVAGSTKYKGSAYLNGYYIGKVLVGVVDPTKFLYIKDGTTTISDGVFDGLAEIKYVYVPDTVTEYESGVFADCTNLTLVVQASSFSGHGLTGYNRVRWNKEVTEDGFEYIESGNGITISKYFGDNSVIEIPAQINGKSIAAVGAGNTTTAEAIVDSAKLTVTKITMPDTVGNIAPLAFLDMSDLEEVNIPASVVGIGINAFAGCTSLTTVNIDVFTVPEAAEMGLTVTEEDLKFTAYEVGQYGVIVKETLAYDDSAFITKLTNTYAECYWFRYGNPFGQ